MAKRKRVKAAGQAAYKAHPGVDFGPAIVLDRGERVVEHPTGRDGVRRARAACECRLDWYWRRRAITARQYEAGLKFRAALKLSQLKPRVSSLYGGAMPGGAGGVFPLDGMREVRAATDGMQARMRDVLVAVCGEDDAFAGPDLALFRDGLTRLADYWRLKGDGIPLAA